MTKNASLGQLIVDDTIPVRGVGTERLASWAQHGSQDEARAGKRRGRTAVLKLSKARVLPPELDRAGATTVWQLGAMKAAKILEIACGV